MKQFFFIFIIILSISVKATNDTCVKAFIYNANPNIDSSNSVPSCLNSDIKFIGKAEFLKSGGNYNNSSFTWNFGDGTILTDDSAITHKYTKSGIYVVKLTVTDLVNNCSSINNAYVKAKVSTSPIIKITKNFNSDSICSNFVPKIIAFVEQQPWTNFVNKKNDTLLIDNSISAISSNLNINFFNENQILTDGKNLKIFAYLEHSRLKDLEIKIICPNGNTELLKEYATTTTNNKTTLGEPVFTEGNITKGIPYYYAWAQVAEFVPMLKAIPSIHKYTDVLGQINPNVKYLPSGIYKPTNENFNNLVGCPLNGEWKIQISDKDNLNNGYLFGWGIDFQEMLIPDSLYLNPTYADFEWFKDDVFIEKNDTLKKLEIKQSDTGWVSLKFSTKNSMKCGFDSTFKIFVKAIPEFEFATPDDTLFCNDDSVRLIGDEKPHWGYLWDAPQGDTKDSIRKHLIHATISGKYELFVYDSITKCISSKSITTTSKQCDIIIPTVFTPNGDGINDLFYIKIDEKSNENGNSSPQSRGSSDDKEIIKFYEKYPGSTMMIFNRNGKKVYESDDYQCDWDGGNNGDGIYFYILKLKNGTTLNGVINIIGKE